MSRHLPPWRKPMESERATRQRFAEKNHAQPKCLYCQKYLRPFVLKDWPQGTLDPIARWIDGYGHMGRGLFCGLNHAAAYAYRYLRTREIHHKGEGARHA